MAAPTIVEVKARIEAIAATMPGMVTPNMNTVAALTPSQLYALDILPTTATRQVLTLDGGYLIERTYRLSLFVAQVERTPNNDDLAAIAALEQAYAIADVLPDIFIARPRLELNGGDAIAFACDEMSDEPPVIMPFGNSGLQYATLRYDLKVTVQAP